MNPLGKKAFVASCVAHGLLLAFLVISPAFMKPVEKDPVIDLPVIEFVANNLIDDALYVPPAPEPTPPQPEPVPEPPVKEVVKVAEPEPEPKPETPKVAPKPEPPKVETQPVWKPNTQVAVSADRREVKVQQPKPSPPDPNSEAQRELDRAINNVRSRSTHVDVKFSSPVVGGSGYVQGVVSRYQKAIDALKGNDTPLGVVEVKIVVMKDGRIKLAQITEGSKKPQIDDIVQKALEMISQVSPFPPGISENEWVINAIFDFEQK